MNPIGTHIKAEEYNKRASPGQVVVKNLPSYVTLFLVFAMHQRQ